MRLALDLVRGCGSSVTPSWSLLLEGLRDLWVGAAFSASSSDFLLFVLEETNLTTLTPSSASLPFALGDFCDDLALLLMFLSSLSNDTLALPLEILCSFSGEPAWSSTLAETVRLLDTSFSKKNCWFISLGLTLNMIIFSCSFNLTPFCLNSNFLPAFHNFTEILTKKCLVAMVTCFRAGPRWMAVSTTWKTWFNIS